jgi:hypothetical protein
MTEVPCGRLGLQSPMPPMLSRASCRTVADLSSLSQHHQRLPPPSDIHSQTHAPSTCARSRNAIFAAKERIESGDTYHQLDLLGRAAVGVGGCRVVRFALATGVHGGALRGCLVGRIVRASAIPGPRTVCDRGVRARGLMSLSLLYRARLLDKTRSLAM